MNKGDKLIIGLLTMLVMLVMMMIMGALYLCGMI